MPRAYIRAGTRVRQFERLIRVQHELTKLGVTNYDLVRLTGLSYQTVAALTQRLVREKRVEVELVDPAMGHQALQLFYPLNARAVKVRKAA